MAEIITKERVPYRIWDKINSKWNELKFNTSANSVDANDGKTLQKKVGAINGITSDLSGESDNIAASIKCVKKLNDSLGGNILIYNESEDAYYIQHGADTVLKKLGSNTGGITLTNLYFKGGRPSPGYEAGVQIGAFSSYSDHKMTFDVTNYSLVTFSGITYKCTSQYSGCNVGITYALDHTSANLKVLQADGYTRTYDTLTIDVSNGSLLELTFHTPGYYNLVVEAWSSISISSLTIT